MRLLLLGASGFLGGHVAAAAERDPRIELLRHRRFGSNLLALDVEAAGPAALDELLQQSRADAIVNCIGATGGDRLRLERLNVQLVERLLAAVERTLPNARFVQLGSAAEYGAVPTGVAMSEMTPERPVGDYGRTKLAATRLVVSARSHRRLDGIVLRVFNPIGARAPATSLAGTAANRMRAAMKMGAASIRLGPLDDHRDFVDARDVADAVLSAVRSGTEPVLNIGSGRAVRSRVLVRELAAIAGFHGNIVEQERGSERSPAVPWQQAAIELAFGDLSWKPRRTLRDALLALWSSLGGRDGEVRGASTSGEAP